MRRSGILPLKYYLMADEAKNQTPKFHLIGTDVDAKSIPKGLRNIARGCGSYPGSLQGNKERALKGLRNRLIINSQALQAWLISSRFSRGSFATPGFDSKARWALLRIHRLFASTSVQT